MSSFTATQQSLDSALESHKPELEQIEVEMPLFNEALLEITASSQPPPKNPKESPNDPLTNTMARNPPPNGGGGLRVTAPGIFNEDCARSDTFINEFCWYKLLNWNNNVISNLFNCVLTALLFHQRTIGWGLSEHPRQMSWTLSPWPSPHQLHAQHVRFGLAIGSTGVWSCVGIPLGLWLPRDYDVLIWTVGRVVSSLLLSILWYCLVTCDWLSDCYWLYDSMWYSDSDSDMFQQVPYDVLMMSVVLISHKCLVWGLVVVAHPTIGPASDTVNIYV